MRRVALRIHDDVPSATAHGTAAQRASPNQRVHVDVLDGLLLRKGGAG